MRPANTTVVHFSSQVVRSVVGFLATLYFANELGAGPLGIYFVAIALLAWLGIPATAIASSVKKRLSEHGEARFISAGVALNAIIGVVLGAVLLALSPWVDDYLGAPMAHLVAALLVVRVAFGTVTAGLEGENRVAHSGILKTVDQLLRAGAQVGLVVLGYGAAGLVFGHTVALGVAAVIGLVLLSVRPTLPNRATLADLISYAKFSWLGTIRTQTFSWMDVLILNLFVVPALIGVYEVAWKLASVFVLVNISIQHTLFPEISSLAVRDEYGDIQKMVNHALLYSGTLTIPGLFGALVVGGEVLEIYSEEFVQGQLVLVVLLLARSIDVYGSVFNNTLNAVDRPNVTFRINLVFVTVNVALNVVLIYAFGWIGAAVATVTSAGIVLWMGYRAVVELVGSFSLPYRGISAQVTASATMALVVLGLKNLVLVRSTVVTVGLVLVGAVVYLVVLLVLSRRIRGKVRSLASSAFA